jgi:hypothetical protein
MPPPPKAASKGKWWIVAAALVVAGGLSAALFVMTKTPEPPCNSATPPAAWTTGALSKLVLPDATFCALPAAEASTHAKLWVPLDVVDANLQSVAMAQDNGWDRTRDNWYHDMLDHAETPKWSELEGREGTLRIEVSEARGGAMIELKVGGQKRASCKALSYAIIAHRRDMKGKKGEDVVRDAERLRELRLTDAKVDELRTRFVKHVQDFIKQRTAADEALTSTKATKRTDRAAAEAVLKQAAGWDEDRKLINEIDAYCADVMEGEPPPP